MILFRLLENDPFLIVPWAFALLIGITIHEFSHGFVAYQLGDDTAEKAGRLTLNPFAHLDLFGSLLLLLVGLGWAQPVPIDIRRIKKGAFGRFLVSFAGIFVNIIFAVICAIGLRLFLTSVGLDESNYLAKFLALLIYFNLSLFVFNLIPIAPLDGYRMIESIAPRFFAKLAPFMERWGFFILLILVFFTNSISYLISFVISLFSITFQLPIYNLAFDSLLR